MGAHRLPLAALGFAIAAALSSWNPLSAPFGVVVGLAAAVLALRAVTERRRPVAFAALGIALAAAIVSGFVLARTAGVGRRGPGESIVSAPSGDEVEAQLDAAAEQTRAARERASQELQALEKTAPVGPPPPQAPPPAAEPAPPPAPDGAGRR